MVRFSDQDDLTKADEVLGLETNFHVYVGLRHQMEALETRII